MAISYAVTTLLLFSLLLTAASAATNIPKRSTTSTEFIQTSCSATRFPAVCFRSLSVFANAIQKSPLQLAQTALTVSISRAQSASGFVSRMSKVQAMNKREFAAVKDCVENIGDSVDRLRQSLRELKHTGQVSGNNFSWQMSNVQTWVSAALTDENTCVEGFAGRAMDGKVKTTIRGKIVNVAQVTSNALALINKLVGVRQSGAVEKELVNP